jgi:hypothetical protein
MRIGRAGYGSACADPDGNDDGTMRTASAIAQKVRTIGVSPWTFPESRLRLRRRIRQTGPIFVELGRMPGA